MRTREVAQETAKEDCKDGWGRFVCYRGGSECTYRVPARGMSRSDLKEIGEMLDESDAAWIVVGEATIERAVEEATERAKKEMKKEVRAQAKEIEKAIDQA